MAPTPRRRIVVETTNTSDVPSSELRFRTRRNDATYLSGTPLPPGVPARGHVVGPLTLSDLEAVVAGCVTIIPTTLVIEDSEPRGDVAGLPFTAMNFDGIDFEGTIDIRPATTPLGAQKLVVDVVLRKDDDADATDQREVGPSPAAALGAVLAELRDLRHRLRTAPMTERQIRDHLEAILAVAHELADDEEGRRARASSRETACATARRVAVRYAQVVLRDEPEHTVEEAIVRSSKGFSIAAWEVHRLLLLKGHRTDDVRFVESWWPGQVVFEGSLAGRPVVRGTVIIDCKFDGRKIEPYATLRIDAVFEPNGYSVSADASLTT